MLSEESGLEKSLCIAYLAVGCFGVGAFLSRK